MACGYTWDCALRPAAAAILPEQLAHHGPELERRAHRLVFKRPLSGCLTPIGSERVSTRGVRTFCDARFLADAGLYEGRRKIRGRKQPEWIYGAFSAGPSLPRAQAVVS